MVRTAIALAGGVFCLALVAQGFAADATQVSAEHGHEQLDADQAGKLIADLGHDEFARREQAGRQLLKAGASAVEALVRTANGTELEASWRAHAILRQMTRRPDDSAEAAYLGMLRLDSLDVAQRAAISAQLADHRRAQLKRRFTAQGGQLIESLIMGKPYYLQDDVPIVASKDDIPTFAPTSTVAASSPATPDIRVILPEDWAGGAAGLAPLIQLGSVTEMTVDRAPLRLGECLELPKMPRLRRVTIQYVDLSNDDLKLLGQLAQLKELRLYGTGVDANQAEALRKRLPNVELDVHGGGYLGVIISEVGGGCAIRSVAEGSAAERAGLRPDDWIMQANGQPIRSFAQFRDLLKAHRYDRPLELRFRRDGEDHELRMRLGERPDIDHLLLL